MRHGSWLLALCASGLMASVQAATPVPPGTTYYLTLEKDGQVIAEQEVRPSWGPSAASEMRHEHVTPVQCVTDGAPFVADRVTEGETVRLLVTPDGAHLGVSFHAAAVRRASAVCGRSFAGPEVDSVTWMKGNVELNTPYEIAAPEYLDKHTMVPHTYVVTVFNVRPTVTVKTAEQVAVAR